MKFVLSYSKFIFFLLLGLSGLDILAYANETENPTEALSANACERIKNDETISSVRLRAIDKATFEAVKNLPEVAELQQYYSEHDLNVLIYSLVDNYIEDLNTKTTLQDEQKICVDINGYIQKDNILLAQEEFLNSTPAAQEPDLSEEENKQNSSENLISAKEENIETPETSTVSLQQNTPTEDETQVSDEDMTSVYIAPLEFFNETKSQNLVLPLKKIFLDHEAFLVTENSNQADYLVTAKVLKAKVDPINAQTNRMQMVVSVTAEKSGTDTSFSEHQNRFILFESGDDEQKVAADLLNKLLDKAGKLVMKKIEHDAQIETKTSTPFITPKKTN